VLFPLTLILALASFLPLLSTNLFIVRFMDFPRLQIALVLIVVLVAYLVSGAWRDRSGKVVVVLAIASLGYHFYRVHPLLPLFSEVMAPQVADCAETNRLRVLVANVKKSNRQDDALFDLVGRTAPDVFLVMETNAWWDEKLKELNESFPYRIQSIPEEAAFFGIHVLSRYPLQEPKVEFYAGVDTPTVVTGVALPSGETVEFFGVHPRPPEFFQPTTMRDAVISSAALAAQESTVPSVVAGDFNAVPWERISRRAMRIAGLLDPRVGRGLFVSYDVNSLVKKWPLDQILFQDQLALQSFERLPSFGSDHYPILADLCLRPEMAGRQQAPEAELEDIVKARAEIEAAQAMPE
jgi:endonuclease/exonuclease/phosphatase (EEP) superfamily protein YafD